MDNLWKVAGLLPNLEELTVVSYFVSTDLRVHDC